ncbi:uncharacterized protein BCR38DRAFT_482464 [Pseudomassariella vexata]|uniref:2'-5' RNA ligase superfamily-domain-containing protein n=1 Tax=Pseudomassariella vexata TaxID=1141098 RepID=A0A1Y2ECM2_9PEZI|nr:uncharacterized protein BCR38DRAFT_482464 [Pseudomassariella vexata]ORY68986.1 hypothetical protein BCR38DRAFT_482464 [Pseudomassariella vexata]
MTTYQRRDDHKPRTAYEDEDHYVLTLKTDPELQTAMSALRTKYFPPKLLKVNAHVSLFHALPGSMLPKMKSDISSLASRTTLFHIKAGKPFRMARGVGISVDGLEPAAHIHKDLQELWRETLSIQDRGKFRGHYTIMNKVTEAEEVDACLAEVKNNFHGCSGTVTGLSLWKYDRGWWVSKEDFGFGIQHGGQADR